MRPNVTDKLLKIVAEINTNGNASLTRLTVLKKWFEQPGRLGSFALWLASQAKSQHGKTNGVTGDLVQEAGALLANLDSYAPTVNRAAAERLYDQLRDFQNEYQHQQWGSVRIVHNWDLMLVEQGLAIWLWHTDSPAHGYKLAADYCQHYDPRYGNGLNGPSRAKIQEIVRFISATEAWEEGAT